MYELLSVYKKTEFLKKFNIENNSSVLKTAMHKNEMNKCVCIMYM